MNNPYMDLPEKAFWRTAVADKDMLEISEMWEPKFRIRPRMKIATFGSCFAQHFGKALRARKFGWHNGEPAPLGLSEENAQRFNYNQFSCRTANIYTTSLLLQWVSWALGESEAPEVFWEKDGRFFDPFRPRIEPGGFESVEEMLASRQVTIKAMAEVIKTTSIFVFTLGLTESWFDVEGGYEYPMCPGTVAGEFDAEKHKFVAQDFDFVRKNLRQVTLLLRKANPKIKMLLTVSPVPLTATNSGGHVLVATSASKAILRAVAEFMSKRLNYVDYFPSFEIINSPVFKGVFFADNLRQVEQHGVDFVMGNFFKGLGLEATEKPKKKRIPKAKSAADKLDDIACEEELLAAFATPKEAK